MKTKGALLWGPRQPWTVEQIEIGDPREGEVKIQVEVVGMCHSDDHLDATELLAGSLVD